MILGGSYRVVLNENIGRWNCNCLRFTKIGLPCSHELRVVHSILPQIGAFWIIDLTEVPVKTESVRKYPMKTRRNRKK